MGLEEYINEFKTDTIVNELNLRDKTLAMPAIKAKWVSRLINHKNTLNNLEKTKNKVLKDILPVVKSQIPVKLSDNAVRSKVENTKEISEIMDNINKEKEIIEFLERIEKTISSMSYDVSNIIKVMQLETL